MKLTETARKTARSIDLDTEKLAKQAWQQAEKTGSSLEQEAQRLARKAGDKDKKKSGGLVQRFKSNNNNNNGGVAKRNGAAAKKKTADMKAKQRAFVKEQQAKQKALNSQQRQKQKAFASQLQEKQKAALKKQKKDVSYERSATSFQSMLEKRTPIVKTYTVVPPKKKRGTVLSKKQKSSPVKQSYPVVSQRASSYGMRRKPKNPFRETFVSNALQFVLVTATLTSISSILAVLIDNWETRVFGEAAFSLDMILSKQRIVTGE